MTGSARYCSIWTWRFNASAAMRPIIRQSFNSPASITTCFAVGRMFKSYIVGISQKDEGSNKNGRGTDIPPDLHRGVCAGPVDFHLLSDVGAKIRRGHPKAPGRRAGIDPALGNDDSFDSRDPPDHSFPPMDGLVNDFLACMGPMAGGGIGCRLSTAPVVGLQQHRLEHLRNRAHEERAQAGDGGAIPLGAPSALWRRVTRDSCAEHISRQLVYGALVAHLRPGISIPCHSHRRSETYRGLR